MIKTLAIPKKKGLDRQKHTTTLKTIPIRSPSRHSTAPRMLTPIPR